MSTEATTGAGTVVPFATSIAMQQSLPLDEAIAFAVAHGCNRFYIEGAYRTDCADTWDRPRIERYRGVIAEHGLTPIFHGNYKLPLGHENDDVRSAAVRSVTKEIDVAAALGAPLIVHGSCIFSHHEPLKARAEAIEAFARSVATLQAHAERVGGEIWLENLENYKNRHPFHTIYSKRSEYQHVLERVPGTKFILDVGHENVGSGDPVGVFDAFADRIVALDVNDNRGDHDTHYGLGRGTVDFAALVRAIARRGWRGHLTVETRGSSLDEDLRHLAALHRDAGVTAPHGESVDAGERNGA